MVPMPAAVAASEPDIIRAAEPPKKISIDDDDRNRPDQLDDEELDPVDEDRDPVIRVRRAPLAAVDPEGIPEDDGKDDRTR